MMYFIFFEWHKYTFSKIYLTVLIPLVFFYRSMCEKPGSPQICNGKGFNYDKKINSSIFFSTF
jgi:hypothetical protein